MPSPYPVYFQKISRISACFPWWPRLSASSHFSAACPRLCVWPLNGGELRQFRCLPHPQEMFPNCRRDHPRPAVLVRSVRGSGLWVWSSMESKRTSCRILYHRGHDLLILCFWFLILMSSFYRDRLKMVQILLSRTQAGPGRAGKQEQQQTSRNHVQAF